MTKSKAKTVKVHYAAGVTLTLEVLKTWTEDYQTNEGSPWRVKMVHKTRRCRTVRTIDVKFTPDPYMTPALRTAWENTSRAEKHQYYCPARGEWAELRR